MMKYRLLLRIFLIKNFEKISSGFNFKYNNVQNVTTGCKYNLKINKTHLDHKIRNLCYFLKKVFWKNQKLCNFKFLGNIYNEIQIESLIKYFFSISNIFKEPFIEPCYTIKNGNVIWLNKEFRIINSNAELFLHEKETVNSKIEKNKIEALKLNTNRYTFRTHTCGELKSFDINKKVRLMGWLNFNRNNKFLLIRDGYGITQLCIPEERHDLLKLLNIVTLESVIYAEGIVQRRPPGQENLNLSTGEIEISVTDLKILSKAKQLPFCIRDFNVPNETIRLKFRYLDLRHKFMQTNLRFRSDMIHKIRCFLIEKLNFVEVETPTLFKKTPGGAQEFIVPTVKKDKFYSLVQSPQQFKQLLMIGSIDRYFQIARCYRDEPSASDRQPEFTQLDMEMSFCERDDVLDLVEDLLKYCWPKHLGSLTTPFQRMTYHEAFNFYGTDKPDLRCNWKLRDLTSVFIYEKENCKGKYKVQEFINEKDFAVFAFVGPQGESIFSNKLKKNILDEISSLYPNVKYLFFPIKMIEKIRETLKILFCSSVALSIEQTTQFKEGDVLFLALGTKENVLKSLGKIRISFAQYLDENKIEEMEKNVFKFLWILDFPMFERKNSSIVSTHHPFTQPHPNDISLLGSDPLKVRSLHYDLVLNGSEVGGGSIRINDSGLQKMILEDILKINSEPLSHLLEGLASGAPPHGGIALGLDRLISILCKTNNIRNVIAFPKGSQGDDLMCEAPSEISKEDKERYHIK